MMIGSSFSSYVQSFNKGYLVGSALLGAGIFFAYHKIDTEEKKSEEMICFYFGAGLSTLIYTYLNKHTKWSLAVGAFFLCLQNIIKNEANISNELVAQFLLGTGFATIFNYIIRANKLENEKKIVAKKVGQALATLGNTLKPKEKRSRFFFY
jgi:hypothetical protein